MRRIAVFFSACLVLGSTAEAEKKPSAVPQNLINPSEIHAELLSHLYVNKVKAGDPILARVTDPWEARGCKLRQGAILTGHVIKAETATIKSGFSTMEFSFDSAECNDQGSTTFPFTLVTILPSTSGADTDQLESTSLIQTLVSPQNMVSSYERAMSEKGQLAFALTNVTSVSTFHHPQLPPGQVVGFRSLKLDAGIGPDNASRVYMQDKNLRLERTTGLILIPTPLASVSVAKLGSSELPAVPSGNVAPIKDSPSIVASAAPAPPPPAPAPEPLDESDVCSTVCNAVGDTAPIIRAANASYRLPVSSLGFAANMNRAIESFGYDATLTYLDESNLLFTFDAHKLRHRVMIGLQSVPVHTIRAILIDPKTHAIKHAYNWEIYGYGQYLWPAGPGRIIVHVNHQLSLLGPDLHPIYTLPLEGPFAWASVSPSGNHIVVGTIRERHQQQLHQLLQEQTGQEPEEDVSVQLYDGDFKLLLSTIRSTRERPAILSDAGELRLHATAPHRWELDEERWDHTQQHLITSTSYCRPTISAQSSGHLFLTGCSEASGGLRWYRMLRPDGHPVLKKTTPSQEIEQSADTSSPSTFAVRVVKTLTLFYPGKAFNKIDLDSEEISVYRIRDGHPLFKTKTYDAPLIVQSFALSPTGRDIALLDSNAISFYTISEP